MKLCIDAGHGGHDPGAEYAGLKEKDVVLDVAKMLDRHLVYATYIDTFLTRPVDSFLGLQARTTFANTMSADLFLSIHTNADPDMDEEEDPEAEGCEVWINPGSVKGRAFATCIQQAFALQFPDEPFRGIKERGLYVVKHTMAPAALVEIGFIDHSETNRELRNPEVRSQIAYALQMAVHQYAQLRLA